MTDIEREAKACRVACANVKVGDVMSHIHHGLWLEILTEPIENRINFILTNKPIEEQAERLRRMRPFDWQKADADWQKADADWQKAGADRQKAYADWQKAYADWQKAYADWQKAGADWQKAYVDRQKAYADRQKAYADWQKAYASPAMLAIHPEVCGCAWGPKTDIFGKER
jgi:hypothetical protein